MRGRRPFGVVLTLAFTGMLTVVASATLSCASKPRGSAETTVPPPRIKDSPPEKRAALRNADPNMGAEADEQRWGFEAARERKERTDEKNGANAPGASTTPASPPPTGPFDIRAKSSAPKKGATTP